ncbi:calcyphosin-2-like isoform X3 [Liolophura sinensis]
MGKSQVTEEDVNRAVEAVKNTYTKSDSPRLRDSEDLSESGDEEEQLQLSYTNKSFPSFQDSKKMDATEFEEFKRKQHLIETVMVDQLSRAVISAPEQDTRPAPRSHRPGMPRGTNRSLHESKVSTNTTATENLLQRRVRFGARLLTRNGHDAIRELTGFFFHVDGSLTIYEFKQFGKSAKALPFIPRGQYTFARGRRLQEPYTLTDIYPGANLEFKTAGLHSLPDSVRQQKVAVFRVTDVDDVAKSKIILSGVKPSDREKAYARLHMPKSKAELEDRVLMLEIQTFVRKLLKKRGVRTVMGLGHHCRKLDRNNTGLLPRFELEKALLHYHIDLGEGVLASLLAILDEEGTGYLDYPEFLRTVLGEMNEYRKSFVLRAFRKIDAGKQGVVTCSDLKKFYNAAKHPKVKSGQCSEMAVLKSFLDSFQYCEKTEEVTFQVFEEYYEGLSVGVENDEDFANILRNSWNL